MTVTEGHPDIGGSRASMAMMVAEVLGVPFETGPPGRRRHDGDRLQRLDRRQPRHLCRRHGGDAGDAKGRRGAEEARRDHLGHQPRGGRVEGRQGLSRPAPMPAASSRSIWPRSPPRRRAPAARSAPRCRSTRKARRRASRPISAMSRSTRRPATSRSCATPRSRMSAARSIPPMSRGRCRAAWRRGSAGRSARNTSTTRMGGSKTRASSTIACRSPRTCR